MKAVYHPTDIENFKLTHHQKKFLIDGDFTLAEIKEHFKTYKNDYYKKCDPVGYLYVTHNLIHRFCG